MVHHRLIALYFRLGCFIFTLIGLMAETNVFAGEFDITIMVYYTIQSNILALILFALLSSRTLKGLRNEGRIGKTGYYARFELVVVIDILLTMIVYWMLLAPTMFSMNSSYSQSSFGNIATHLVTPLLCLIDYFAFTDSGHLHYKDVYSVLIYPLLYMIVSSIAGLLGYVYRINPDGTPVRFPYFFYNFDQIGAQALIYISALVLFFLLLSHGFYLLDKKINKPVLIPKQKRFSS